MITQYIAAAMAKANYKVLDDGEGIFASIPGFPGLWAEGSTADECREELQSALEGWLLLSLSRHMDIPVVDGIDLAVREVA